MAHIRPFVCCRPQPHFAQEVAALPYDVFTRKEAADEIAKHPHSFLKIDKSCAYLPNEVGEYDDLVYSTAADLFATDVQNGVYLDENQAHFFLYRLIKDGHAQTGIVSCIAIEDMQSGVLKRHENTRSIKLEDRVRHIEALEAQTGLVFVAYPAVKALDKIVEQTCANTLPLYDFVTDDGVSHTVWRVDDKNAEALISASFAELDALYIADGHHRSAAAQIVAEKSDATQNILIIAYPDNQLKVLDYNRVVFDTNGLSQEELLSKIADSFTVENVGVQPVKPSRRGDFALYLDGEWYKLTVNKDLRPNDPVAGLDVSLLHDLLLEPILGIDDPKVSDRIAFVGGVRGLQELKTRVDANKGGAAFALYPCTLEELFTVADAGLLMPPKSTWFDPKPRSGLFIRRV